MTFTKFKKSQGILEDIKMCSITLDFRGYKGIRRQVLFPILLSTSKEDQCKQWATILRFLTSIWFLQEPAMCTAKKLIYTFAKGQCDGKTSDIQFWFRYICNHFQRNKPVAEKESYEAPRNCSSSPSFSSSLCFDKKFSKQTAGLWRCGFLVDFFLQMQFKVFPCFANSLCGRPESGILFRDVFLRFVRCLPFYWIL